MIGKWIQKIKKNKRQLGVGALALLLVGVMGVNLLQNSTSTVYAAEPERVVDLDTTNAWTDYIAPGGTVSTQNVGRIWTDKSVMQSGYSFSGNPLPDVEIGDSNFLIALSALSSTSNLKTMVKTSVPLDIVLVLDMSGSMDQYFGSGANRQSRISALKTAVNNFIDATASINDNIENPDERHEISIVKFAGDKSNNVGDDKYWGFLDRYNYSQVVTNLTSYTSSNANSLKRTVNELEPGGGTQADYGMELAEAQLNSHGRENTQQVVVFFTDGEPGDGSYFDQSVANGAVQVSRNIKQKEDAALVYTVGIFDGASSTNMYSNANQFMQAVSSNYPNATAYNNRGERNPEGDYYKTASDSDELNNIFEEISDEIQQGVGSGSPIQEIIQEGATPGNLTFTDQLGSYMHVTGTGAGEDKMQLAYADQLFTSTSKTTEGNIDTYHFEGTVAGNSVYGETDLSDLIITVKRSSEPNVGDKVTVTLPASLIPLRHYDVDTDAGTMNVTSAYPVRLFYGASIKEEAKNAISNPTSDLYNEIFATNKSEDGTKIEFLSNDYTGGVGDTTASFTPSEGNKFYYYTSDTALYLDQDCTIRATNGDIDRAQTLYYEEPYWALGNGNSATKLNAGNAIDRDDLDFHSITTTTDGTGNAYIPAHTPRRDRPNTLNNNKDENNTNTAGTVLSPQWAENSVIQHLGNNGKLSYPAAGQLEIKKTVEWGNASDTTKQDQDNFDFTIKLKNVDGDPVEGEFPYEVFGATSNEPVREGTVLNDGKINLQDGQRVVISNLPSGIEYTVTEDQANLNGFTTEDINAMDENNVKNDGVVSGKIASGQQSVSFQNTYNADIPVLLSTEGTIQVKKVLNGRDWRDDDEFTFNISAEKGAPSPTETTIKINKGDKDFVKAFGNIEFTDIGEYRYAIRESQDGNITGIDYSAALYRVIVKVVDGGNGNLSIESISLDKLNTDGGDDISKNPENIDPVEGMYTATFTNDYLTDGSGSSTISGTKEYTDKSGNNGIDANKFWFKIEALGGYDTQDGMTGDKYPISAADVPLKNKDGEQIKTEQGNVVNAFTFETLYFDGNDVGNTYVYKVTEKQGDEVNMSYDPAVYTVSVAVSEVEDQDQHAHINTDITYTKTVNGVTEDADSIVFTNTYDPEDVTLGNIGAASIEGKKTLKGRDMTNEDAFTFTLTPIGQNTLDAITNGNITGIDQTGLETKVNGPQNKDEAKAFAFNNITFNRVGTYYFVIDEVDTGNKNGITYDNHTSIVQVSVTLNKADGKLVANITYPQNDNAFENVYEASENYGADGEVGINVTKTLKDRPMAAGEFTFTIQGVNSDSVTEVEANAKLTAADKGFTNTAGAANYEVVMDKLQNLTFNQNDAGKTYRYIVDEVEPSEKLAGVTYDLSQYQVDIKVIDNGNGTMHTVTTVTRIMNSDGTTANEIIVDHTNSDAEGYTAPTFGFVNDYDPTPVEVGSDVDDVLQVEKTVTGAPNTEDFAFSATFNATESSGSIDAIEGLTDNKLIATISDDFDAEDTKTVEFGTIKFTAPGTYVFDVKEDTLSTKAGWTYDNEIKKVTIAVTDRNADNEYDGKLYIQSITYNGVVEITNSYKPNEVIVGGEGVDNQITVQKSVIGSNTEADFTFQLEPIIEEEDKDKWNSVQAVDPSFDGVTSITGGVTTDTPKSATFGGIKFTEKGTFEFNMFEVGAAEFNQGTNRKGWTYDEHTSKVTINVTDEDFDGQLEASVTYDNTNATTDSDKSVTGAAAFTNKYSATPFVLEKDTETGMGVQKFVTGAPNAEDFEFVATFNENDSTGSLDAIEGLTNDKLSATISDDFNAEETKAVDFDTVTFKSQGLYVFDVKEINADSDAPSGWTYDSSTKQIRVNVEDNGEGTLVASVDSNDPLFTNHYVPNSVILQGENSLKVTKEVTGAPAPSEFSFTLTLKSGDEEGIISGLDSNNSATVSTTGLENKFGDGAKQTVNFDALTFNKVGKYEFTVVENEEATSLGWLYDDSEKTITVNVTDDNHDGQLDAEVIDNNPTFTNKYDAEDVTIGTDGEVGINVQKTLVGRAWEANDSFEFEISAVTEGAPLPKEKTISLSGTEGTNDAVTNAFGSITYTKDMLDGAMSKDFIYTITEISTGGNGVVVDSAKERMVTVKITDYASGALSATISYDNSVASSESDKTVTVAAAFTNTYDASSTDETVPTNFTLTKEFENHEWTDDYAFQFKLIPVDGAPMPEANESIGVTIDAEGNAIKTVYGPQDTGKATFDFGAITYDQAGKYVYTVTEIPGDNAGIDYSTNIARVKVTVTDKDAQSGASTGKLVASATVENSTFTNKYSSELDYVGKGGIKLVKNLTGYDLTKDNQFTFTLSAADEASKEKAGMQDMSEDVFNTENTMDDNGLSTSTIQLLPKMQKFTQDDVGKVYEYTISETSEQKPGYTNDTTEYTIQISTSDDGSGTLIVSTRITGTNETDITYEYTQSKQKAETGVAQVVFNNTYTSSTNTEGYDASVNLTGTKTLTNRPMVDGEFQFNVLINSSVVSSGTNTADGIVTFTPINYTNDDLIRDHANGIASKEGNTYTYVYDVEEVTPGNGVSIVAGKFSVTVKVTDNGDGKLVTKVIYPEGGLAFENAYGQSASAELKINGKKSLAENGTNHPDITDKFEFTITGSEGAPMPEKTTVKNDAAGNVDFGKIVYTMQNVFGDDGQQAIVEQETPVTEEQTTTVDGSVSEETEEVVGLTEQVETYSEKRQKTFTYEINESGSVPGVTNDTSKIITVTVTDNGNGTISVTSDTNGTFEFVNTYVPEKTDETSPTDSSVTIKKVLDGRDLKENEFTFVLSDENGNSVTATNDIDGNVIFPKMTFDKAGIYTYTISEVDDSKGGVAYDTTTYKAIATVTDDTSGKLKVEWKVTDSQGKEVKEITFNNNYTVQPTSLSLGATKVLEGRELADKEFLFVLTDEEGNIVEEAYNDATGKVEFSELVFDKAGTYNYTVSEKNTGAKGITYDESVYNIQVEVVDNGDGTLNMTTTTTKDGEVSSIVFRNKAEKDSVPEQPEKGDTSNTSTRTFAGLFTSLAVDAAALAGIATLLKKRNAKK